MPFAAIIPAIGMLVGDALSATGAIVNCVKLHRCHGRMHGQGEVNGTAGAPPTATAVMPVVPQMRFARPKMLWARQDGVGLCGVPQYNFDMCQDQLRGVVVDTDIPSPGGKWLFSILLL